MLSSHNDTKFQVVEILKLGRDIQKYINFYTAELTNTNDSSKSKPGSSLSYSLLDSQRGFDAAAV